MKQALVLACGNSQRGDDGVAHQVVNCLQRGMCDPGTEFQSQLQWTPELAEAISKVEVVIFVDASAGIKPGEVACRQIRSATNSSPGMTHHTSPESLLLLAEELYGKHPGGAYLVTIGGASFEFEEALSEPVRRAIPRSVERIKALLSGVTMPEV
jgi:hydrogenase maturation protease